MTIRRPIWLLFALAVCVAPWRASAEHVAIFAGGCFWCLESEYAALPGVVDATTGYTGGHAPHPTFGEVQGGKTGHYKAVRIVFDPKKVGYDRLLRVFWLSIDPTEPGGQFCDRSDSNRSAIFVSDPAQRAAAEASLAQVERLLRRPVATAILPAKTFWPAEEVFQNYAARFPLRFQYYVRACERDDRLRRVWGSVPMLSLGD